MKIANAVFLLATLSSVAAYETPYLRASAVLKGADDTTDFKTKSSTTKKDKEKDDDSKTRSAPKKKETCEDLSKDECEDDKKCKMKGKKCVKKDSLDFDFEQKKGSKCDGLSKDKCKDSSNCKFKKGECVKKESLVLKGAVYTTDFKAKESTTKKDKEEDNDSKTRTAPKKKTVKECEDLKDKACRKSSECELKEGKCVEIGSLDFKFEEGPSTTEDSKDSKDSTTEDSKDSRRKKSCEDLSNHACRKSSKCELKQGECVEIDSLDFEFENAEEVVTAFV